MPPYCSHGGDVPQFDGTIKAACCQDVSVVRTELAVKYSLYVALCQNTDQVSQTQIIKQLLHLMYVESTVHLLELPCYITVSLPLCITTQCPLCWDQCPSLQILTWSRRKSHFLPPRSYRPTPPSRNAHTILAGGRTKCELLVLAGVRVGLVEDTWPSLTSFTLEWCSTFIVWRACIPVFFILMFSIGVDFDTFHILRIPLLTSK